MCGIFGYLGDRDAVKTVLEGIRLLEYRGYDSAGVAAIDHQGLVYAKQVGKVAALHEVVDAHQWDAHIAISHTRWATNGKPSVPNAHPHFDQELSCALVHNGIIENYQAIRSLLEKKGIAFRSETDTEVIAQLIGYIYKGNLLKAVQHAIPYLRGSFAIAVIHRDHPDELVCAASESTLAIGLGEGEMFVASDARAFSQMTRKALFLQSAEVALVKRERVEVFNSHHAPIEKLCEDLGGDVIEVSKGTFRHYMLKEIHEQPQTLRNALLGRINELQATAIFDELKYTEEELGQIQRVVIVACGTSFHAGLVAALMFEELARIPTQVEISSELRYKNPIVMPNTLVIAISQSGETADTLAAARELQEKGARVIGICNVQGSTLARLVESCMFLRAGPEIGVASTKAFTSQLMVLSLLCLRLARMRQMSLQGGQEFIVALKQLPDLVEQTLALASEIKSLCLKYSKYHEFFFLGRRFMYPTALEGALKLKEIAYVNANAYPAGEMKHGPIALISATCPTIAFCSDKITYSKLLNNLEEIKARGGPVLAIAPQGAKGLDQIADDLLLIPHTLDPLSPILATIASQLFAYEIAMAKGTEIDQPKNLAKSVTVE